VKNRRSGFLVTIGALLACGPLQAPAQDKNFSVPVPELERLVTQEPMRVVHAEISRPKAKGDITLKAEAVFGDHAPFRVKVRKAEPGAESFNEIVARVRRVMERLGEVASERRVVAVSHHNFLHFFLGVTLFGDDFTPALVPGLYQAGHANTGITIFQKVARREMDGVDLPGWVLTTWNDRAHL